MLYTLYKQPFWKQISLVMDMGHMYTEDVFKLKNMQKLIESKEKFDLVIVEIFVNDALLGLAHHFDAPLIVMAPGPMSFMCNHLVGNPSPSSYVPNIVSPFTTNMTIWERMQNLYYDIVGDLMVHFYGIPKHNEILQRYIPDSPELKELMYKVDLILSPSHESINVPSPSVPAIKNVGGYHIPKPKPLPKDLQEFLDNAEEGAIVFSLGSNIKSADLPNTTKKAILNSFSKIKYKVLWKFETDLTDKPENVKIMKWLPQNDVLAHPNVKLFMSHGGLLSVIEAINYGKPILGVPVFWDQQLNIKSAADSGFAISLPFYDITEEKLDYALKEMLTNPKYTVNAKKRQSILLDQPLSPMDTAIFWIEHIIRQKGGDHLRSPGLNLYWYERNMLDIIIILTLITVVIFTIFYIIFKHILKIFGKKPAVKKSKKNQ
ncbi:UDP-glucosyltransferase 2-like isoform X2 [Aethina tumida]|nr:UDP-glucosyltransferase 2-like isoform X2 [Aethina tumida]XP_049823752.1 UDP-glucosyltransferase 2-like isoform X2 [Aethina tumida]